MTIAPIEASAARRAREIKRPADKFFQSALDALSAHVAVLDRRGTIVAVNQAWRRFGRANGFRLPGFGSGQIISHAALARMLPHRSWFVSYAMSFVVNP